MVAVDAPAERLGTNQSPPNQDDVVAEIQQERTGDWTAVIVAGLLFKEPVPGSFMTIDEAVAAATRLVNRSGRQRTVYYRVKAKGRRFVKKTRYVR